MLAEHTTQIQIIFGILIFTFLVGIGFIIYGFWNERYKDKLLGTAISGLSGFVLLFFIFASPLTCSQQKLGAGDYGFVKTQSELILYSSLYSETNIDDLYIYNNIGDTTRVDVFYQKCYNTLGSKLEQHSTLKAEQKQ